MPFVTLTLPYLYTHIPMIARVSFTLFSLSGSLWVRNLVSGCVRIQCCVSAVSETGIRAILCQAVSGRGGWCHLCGHPLKARHTPHAALWQRVWGVLVASVETSGWRRLAPPLATVTPRTGGTDSTGKHSIAGDRVGGVYPAPPPSIPTGGVRGHFCATRFLETRGPVSCCLRQERACVTLPYDRVSSAPHTSSLKTRLPPDRKSTRLN